jgi:DNA-binding transcriptional ArsR family regulator
MLVLADVAEVGTAEIPEKFSPSLRVLAGETGLDKSTVKRHLATLEESGWIVRTRPDAKAQWRGERNLYRLDLPGGIEHFEVGAQDAQVGAENTHPGGTEHPGGGAQKAGGGRTVRPQKTDLTDLHQIPSDLPTPSASLAPAGLTITQRSKRITDAYAAAQPLCRWPAINGIVIRAIKVEKFSDEEIRAALMRLAGEGRTVTLETLRIELEGMPPRASPNGGANRDMLNRAMERAQAKEASGT